MGVGSLACPHRIITQTTEAGKSSMLLCPGGSPTLEKQLSLAMGHRRAVWPELLTGYPLAANPPPAPVFAPGLQPRMLTCVACIKELLGPLASG